MNNGVEVQALQNLAQKIQSPGENSILPMQAHVKWAGGLKHDIKIRNFDPILADEPQFLGGTDVGANPVEFILGALGSCMGIVYVMKATAKGVTIESLEITVEGSLDLKVLLGLKEGRRGLSEVKVIFNVKSSAPQEILNEIYQEVVSESPVGSTLVNNVSIAAKINKL